MSPKNPDSRRYQSSGKRGYRSIWFTPAEWERILTLAGQSDPKTFLIRLLESQKPVQP